MFEIRTSNILIFQKKTNSKWNTCSIVKLNHKTSNGSQKYPYQYNRKRKGHKKDPCFKWVILWTHSNTDIALSDCWNMTRRLYVLGLNNHLRLQCALFQICWKSFFLFRRVSHRRKRMLSVLFFCTRILPAALFNAFVSVTDHVNHIIDLHMVSQWTLFSEFCVRDENLWRWKYVLKSVLWFTIIMYEFIWIGLFFALMKLKAYRLYDTMPAFIARCISKSTPLATQLISLIIQWSEESSWISTQKHKWRNANKRNLYFMIRCAMVTSHIHTAY